MQTRRVSLLCRSLARMTWCHRIILACGGFLITKIRARRGMMLEKIKAEIEAAVVGCRVEIVANPSPSGQYSLLVESARALEVAFFLRDSAEQRLDYCSNVTGIDWMDTETTEKVK